MENCRTSACLAQSVFEHKEMVLAPRESYKGKLDFTLGFSSKEASFVVTPIVAVDFQLLDGK